MRYLLVMALVLGLLACGGESEEDAPAEVGSQPVTATVSSTTVPTIPSTLATATIEPTATADVTSTATSEGTPTEAADATGSPAGHALIIGDPEWAGSSSTTGSFTTIATPLTNPRDDAWVAWSRCTATAYDEADQVIDVFDNGISLALGASTWFVAYVGGATGAPPAVERVDVQCEPEFQATEYPDVGVSLGQHDLNADKMKLLGQFTYTGTEELTQLQVNGIARDASGAFIRNYLAFVPNPQPGTEMTFEAEFEGDRNALDGEVTYEIFIESEGVVLHPTRS